MWPSWESERQRIATTLRYHSESVRELPGIASDAALETLSLQFIASLRREEYYKQVQRKRISASRADPNDPSFDAERAVAFHLQQANVDEAGWLIFLMTHFAKPEITGWLRLRDVYGKLGDGIWDWRSVDADPAAFTTWLAENRDRIRGKFGNHRKYESVTSTGEVVTSYLAWIGPEGHSRKFADAVRCAGNDPHRIFDFLYNDLRVKRFGRLAKFDYLSLIGRYSIAPIDAGSAYFVKATGPVYGARLLFDGRLHGPSSPEMLQDMLNLLDVNLMVTMKVMEDALCNWQKSPFRFIHFKG